MAALSSYLENKLNDHVLGGSDYTRPSPSVYFALYTVAPTESGGGTEVSASGTAYARATVANNSTSFPASAGGVKSNGTAIAFPTATATWGSVVAFGVFDASTAGNLLYFGNLTSARSIAAGDTARFAAGDFSITFE